jgi:hypothetical protein
MANTTKETQEAVKASVTSIYSELLEKRRLEREAKEEAKRIAKEEKEAAKAEKAEDDVIKMTKKERRQRELDNWKAVVMDLTGDDLEYVDEGKKKKKYRKWIDDDASIANLDKKPKKPKKKNYDKEFEAELNLLKSLVADQNKFTADLQKRFQIMTGPNTRDASPLNKTEVELASAIISSRQNALGMVREIGSLKKTKADLYLRQKKQDYEMGNGSNFDSTDLALMGSSIAASRFGDNAMPSNAQISYDSPFSQSSYQPTTSMTLGDPVPQQHEVVQSYAPQTQTSTIVPTSIPGINIEQFDPSTWNGVDGVSVDANTRYENIPHDVIVEWDKGNDRARFKAIRKDNGEELVDCPVPTTDPRRLTFNEKDGTVKGEFDEMYKLEVI